MQIDSTPSSNTEECHTKLYKIAANKKKRLQTKIDRLLHRRSVEKANNNDNDRNDGK
jgi:hypothetical protein